MGRWNAGLPSLMAEFSAVRAGRTFVFCPGWALASLTISLHWSLFLALSVQPLIPIFLRSSVTSSVHLNLGLPILLFAYSFPFSTLLGMAISSILSTWPTYSIFCVGRTLPPWNSLVLISFRDLVHPRCYWMRTEIFSRFKIYKDPTGNRNRYLQLWIVFLSVFVALVI